MLTGRSNTRGGPRGQHSSDRSRGRGGRGRGNTPAPPSSDTSKDAFQAEREANAAKRESRGQTFGSGPRGGRGASDTGRGANGSRGRGYSGRGGFGRSGSVDPSNEVQLIAESPMSVDVPTQTLIPSNPFATNSFSSASSTLPSHNPFAATNTAAASFPPPSSGPAKFNPFATTTPTPNNAFATSSSKTTSPFGHPSSGVFGTPANPIATGRFGAPSQAVATTGFGAPSAANTATPSPFASSNASSTLNPFANGNSTMPTQPAGFSGFDRPSGSAPSVFATSASKTPAQPTSFAGFGQSSTPSHGVFGNGASQTPSQPAPFSGFGQPSAPASSSTLGTASSKPFGSLSNSDSKTLTQKGFSGFSSTSSPAPAVDSPAVEPLNSSSNPFSGLNATTASLSPITRSHSGTTQEDSSLFHQQTLMPSSTYFGSSQQSSSTLGKPSKEANGSRPFSGFASSNPHTANGSIPFGGTSQKTSTSELGGLTSTGSNSASEFSKISNGSQSQSRAKSFTALSSNSKDPYAARIEEHLKRAKIIRPNSLHSNPGIPTNKAATEKVYKNLKEYRERARTSLQQGGLIDDPLKPKRLEDAIPFRATCEDKCPMFEIYERIVEGASSCHRMEMEVGSDGQLQPVATLMVKRHGRSAAGEAAPLPEDIRTPQACRRTVDYLFSDVLGGNLLRSSHGFLWDRTRQVRRDFIFQTALKPSENADHVYCLEQIARFHMVSLHQMSKDGAASSEYSAQQDSEQLARTLHTLIGEYKTCATQMVDCPNEAEFRACFALYHATNSNILEECHSWGSNMCQTEEMMIALRLIEALQNTYNVHGPQRPYRSTDCAQNDFTTFFDIVEDEYTSYTMACLAENHFNRVRLSALRCILQSYRKQRDQTKDWTVPKLNEWLRFDTEEELIAFAEAYKLRFDDDEEGELYLTFEDNSIDENTFPEPKQRFSQTLVERKRGSASLVDLVRAPVYEVVDESENRVYQPQVSSQESYRQPPIEDVQDENSLFIPETMQHNSTSTTTPVSTIQDFGASAAPTQSSSSALVTPTTTAIIEPAKSVFKSAKPAPTFSADFFTKSAKTPSASEAAPVVSGTASISPFTTKPVFSQPLSTEVPMAPASMAATSPFSTLNSGASQNSSSPKSAFSWSSPSDEQAPASTTEKSTFPLSESGAATSPPQPQNTAPAPVTTQAPLPSFTPAASSVSSSSPMALPSVPTKPPGTSFQTFKPSNSSPLAGLPISAPSNAPQIVAASAPIQSSINTDHERKKDNFVNWFMHGADGVFEQYIKFKLEPLLTHAFDIVEAEKAARLANEAHEAAVQQADSHRLRHVSTKYAAAWREIVHQKKVRRNRENARRTREQAAAAAKAKQLTAEQNLVDSFVAAADSKRKRAREKREEQEVQEEREGSLDSLLNAPVHDYSIVNNGNGVERPKHASKSRRHSDKIVRVPHVNGLVRSVGKAAHKSSTQSIDLDRSTLRKSRLENPLRRSLADYPEAFNGASRLSLTKDYAQDRPQISGVQTDYFRLKARGVHTMPDGTPLASSVANSLRKKHSHEEISRADTGRMNGVNGYGRSRSSSRYGSPVVNGMISRTGISNAEFEKVTAKARALMAADKNQNDEGSHSRKRRSVDPDSEGEIDWLARSKRVRADLDQDDWVKEIMEADAVGYGDTPG